MGNPIGDPIAQPNGSSECYGRTDGRTKRPITLVDHLTAVDADARTEIPTIGDAISDGQLWANGQRHPVIRSGERAEIPPHVRAAVWYRDRGKCELCGTKTPGDQPWHLDHITPWSAGGSDDTTNLRVLCERHNMDRSNRIDPTERPRRAATWWCFNCYDHEDFHWSYSDRGLPSCGIHRLDVSHPDPWRCPVVRVYRQRWIEGEYLTWHQVPAIQSGSTIAYCAHCRAPGLTGRPL